MIILKIIGIVILIFILWGVIAALAACILSGRISQRLEKQERIDRLHLHKNKISKQKMAEIIASFGSWKGREDINDNWLDEMRKNWDRTETIDDIERLR